MSGADDLHKPNNHVLSNGGEIYAMLTTGLQNLEKRVEEINRLNVFPVPDRDTGTNMFETLRRTLSFPERSDGQPIREAAAVIAERALYGARGNSGVLLAEFLRGFAQEVAACETIGPGAFAAALRRGANAARAAVSKPVEGTILTVMRDAAGAARGRSPDGGLGALLETAVKAARRSLEATPHLLPLLRRSGVVDAGGAGFLAVLEGMSRYLGGDPEEAARSGYGTPAGEIGPAEAVPHTATATDPTAAFGYCTEVFLRGHDLHEEHIRERLSGLGESLLVIGGGETLRIHIHASDPGKVLSECLHHGSLGEVSVRNMDEQAAAGVSEDSRVAQQVGVATVAVAGGEGFAALFRSLGAEVVERGECPEEELVERLAGHIEALSAREVIVVPNDLGIQKRAAEIHSRSGKTIAVLQSLSMPAGLAALVEWQSSGSLAENLKRMSAAVSAVHLLAVDLHGDQYTALLDGKELAADPDPARLVEAALRSLGRPVELLTVYSARGAAGGLEQSFAAALKETVGVDVKREILYGGQRSPLFLVSLE